MQPQYPNVPGQPYNAMPPPVTSITPPGRHRINVLLLLFIIVGLLLLAAIGFGMWAYSERTDYKNNVDQKISIATEQAVKSAEANKEKDFAEREKSPYKTYTGPSNFGAIKVTYPKTWSAYVEEESNSSTAINGYFHPTFVPSVKSQDKAFALRVELVENDYTDELRKYDDASKNGDVKVFPIRLQKLPSTRGARVEGDLGQEKRGVKVLFPLRDKTLILTTETLDYVKDFDNIILKNLIFNP